MFWKSPEPEQSGGMLQHEHRELALSSPAQFIIVTRIYNLRSIEVRRKICDRLAFVFVFLQFNCNRSADVILAVDLHRDLCTRHKVSRGNWSITFYWVYLAMVYAIKTVFFITIYWNWRKSDQLATTCKNILLPRILQLLSMLSFRVEWNPLQCVYALLYVNVMYRRAVWSTSTQMTRNPWNDTIQ